MKIEIEDNKACSDVVVCGENLELLVLLNNGRLYAKMYKNNTKWCKYIK
jgi:hypothetical protein